MEKINTLTIHTNDQIVYEIDRDQVLDDGKITFLETWTAVWMAASSCMAN
ncbi:MAG: hypothetical protein WBM38_12190 [Arenicellales bacterium]